MSSHGGVLESRGPRLMCRCGVNSTCVLQRAQRHQAKVGAGGQHVCAHGRSCGPALASTKRVCKASPAHAPLHSALLGRRLQKGSCHTIPSLTPAAATTHL